MTLRKLSYLLSCMLFCLVASDLVQGASSLEESIEAQQKKAEAGKEEVLRLTKKERNLYADLAEVEDQIDSLQDKVRRMESELAAIEDETESASERISSLENETEKTRRELAKLLATLWPLHLQEQAGRTEPASAWTESDRRFTWLSSLYGEVADKLVLLENRERQLVESMAGKKRLQSEASVKLAQIRSTRDSLLQKKLAFVRSIREVRAERVSREKALEGILSTIDELNYRLKLSRGGDFKELKGHLPLPVSGELVSGFGKATGPAGRGLSFKSADGAPVKSIFWGKVVHDDVLRGFGRVVIVYHGDDYYSLYAYLSESMTAIGREVEKGETLGLSGIYPEIGGPGLYFELRFKQKAINPERWLALK